MNDAFLIYFKVVHLVKRYRNNNIFYCLLHFRGIDLLISYNTSMKTKSPLFHKCIYVIVSLFFSENVTFLDS
jgi:hypothetical protein